MLGSVSEHIQPLQRRLERVEAPGTDRSFSQGGKAEHRGAGSQDRNCVFRELILNRKQNVIDTTTLEIKQSEKISVFLDAALFLL